jgi:hypothetical protein
VQFYDPAHANDFPNATDVRNVLDEAVLLIRGARVSYSPSGTGGSRKDFRLSGTGIPRRGEVMRWHWVMLSLLEEAGKILLAASRRAHFRPRQ